jgi:benzoylformate decarboxylase
MSSGARGAARERLNAAKAAILAERDALRVKARSLAGQSPVQPLALLNAVGEMLPKDAVVIDETISSGADIRSLIRSDDPQSFYGVRGGGIGWGLPAALGVKLALPHRPVLALVGDGSAVYTCQSLWTAAHERIATVFVIVNNSSYRILKQRLVAQRGLAAQVDRYVLNDPAIDYVGLARSMGVAAERAASVARRHRSHRQGLEKRRAASDRRAGRP